MMVFIIVLAVCVAVGCLLAITLFRNQFIADDVSETTAAEGVSEKVDDNASEKLGEFHNENETQSLLAFSGLVKEMKLNNAEGQALSEEMGLHFGSHDYLGIADITWEKIKARAEKGQNASSIGTALLNENSVQATKTIAEIVEDSGHTLDELNQIVNVSREKLRTAHFSSSDTEEPSVTTDVSVELPLSKVKNGHKQPQIVQKQIRLPFEQGETKVENLKRFFAENPQMSEMDRLNYALASELFTDFSEIAKPLNMFESVVRSVLIRKEKSKRKYDKIKEFLNSQALEQGFDMELLEKYR